MGRYEKLRNAMGAMRAMRGMGRASIPVSTKVVSVSRAYTTQMINPSPPPPPRALVAVHADEPHAR
jgi:hypothetical protein